MFSCGIPVALSRFWSIQTVWSGKIFSIFDIKVLFKLNKNLLDLKEGKQATIDSFLFLQEIPFTVLIYLLKNFFYWRIVDLQCCVGFSFWPHPVACGILVPHPGIKPVPPALEGRVITTGPPGKVLVAQAYPTLCDPMDCRPPGSSVHGILQARTSEWVAISFSTGSSWPRDWTRVSCIGKFTLSHVFLIFFK